jgi:hypothetical protein
MFYSRNDNNTESYNLVHYYLKISDKICVLGNYKKREDYDFNEKNIYYAIIDGSC